MLQYFPYEEQGQHQQKNLNHNHMLDENNTLFKHSWDVNS